jgi:hypothetical protein
MMLYQNKAVQCENRKLRLLVLILPVGGSANSISSVVSSCNFYEKYLFRRATWNLYFMFSILDFMIVLWVREAELLINK